MNDVRRTRVYVAGPITQGDELVNTAHALYVGEKLMRLGYAPYVPHAFRPTGVHDFDHNEWMAIDLPWVEVADFVLRLPGDSTGADLECEFAKTRGIPVYTMSHWEEPLTWLVSYFKPVAA